MSQTKDLCDPKGLIRESYAMDIGDAECRSILMDWALSLDPEQDMKAAIRNLLEQYDAPDHPMTALLHEGLKAQPHRRRRSEKRGL